MPRHTPPLGAAHLPARVEVARLAPDAHGRHEEAHALALDHELAAPPTAPIAAQGLAVWAHPLPSCRHKVLDPAHEQRAVAS